MINLAKTPLKMTAQQTIANAILRSISHNERVQISIQYAGDVAALIAEIESCSDIPCDVFNVDHAIEDDGRIDIWGEVEDGSEWRICVTLEPWTARQISVRAGEIAGCCWEDREETGTLSEQIRAIIALPNRGTDGDISDEENDELRALASLAESLE